MFSLLSVLVLFPPNFSWSLTRVAGAAGAGMTRCISSARDVGQTITAPSQTCSLGGMFASRRLRAASSPETAGALGIRVDGELRLNGQM